MNDDHFDSAAAADYVLGVLAAPDAARIAAHAAVCAPCRHRLQAERDLARRLRAGLTPLPPGQNAQRLHALQPPLPPRAAHRPLWQRVQHALALVMLVGVIAGGLATAPTALDTTAAAPAARAALVQPTVATATRPSLTANRIADAPPTVPQLPHSAPRPTVQTTPPVAAADQP